MEFCYILKLQDHDLVKIGITKNIQSRITSLEKDLGTDFDLMESYLFTSKRSNSIRSLEHQLLHDTINDRLPRDHPFTIPEKSKLKYTELRKADNVPKVVDLLVQKIELLNLPVKFYTGIDISGFQSEVIPAELIPYNIHVHNEFDLFFDEFKDLMEKEMRNPMHILQEVIYLGLKTKGVELISPRWNRKENCYYVKDRL